VRSKSRKNRELVCKIADVGAIIVGIIPTFKMPAQQLLTFPTNGTSWQTLVLLLVIAPVLEEFFLRHGVQKGLIDLRLPFYGVLLVPAVMFGLMHLHRSWALAVLVIPLGVISGVLYQRANSWRKCAVLHAAANGVWLLFINT
jgi:membrane protease YdiL (CAAX protease family)